METRESKPQVSRCKDGANLLQRFFPPDKDHDNI